MYVEITKSKTPLFPLTLTRFHSHGNFQHDFRQNSVENDRCDRLKTNYKYVVVDKRIGKGMAFPQKEYHKHHFTHLEWDQFWLDEE